MITKINKYTRPVELLNTDTFVTVDTVTNKFADIYNYPPDTIKNYYCYHNYGKLSDRYKQYVNMNYVEVCEAEDGDDLSGYGFTKCNGRWCKN